MKESQCRQNVVQYYFKLTFRLKQMFDKTEKPCNIVIQTLRTDHVSISDSRLILYHKLKRIRNQQDIPRQNIEPTIFIGLL